MIGTIFGIVSTAALLLLAYKFVCYKRKVEAIFAKATGAVTAAKQAVVGTAKRLGSPVVREVVVRPEQVVNVTYSRVGSARRAGITVVETRRVIPAQKITTVQNTMLSATVDGVAKLFRR